MRQVGPVRAEEGALAVAVLADVQPPRGHAAILDGECPTLPGFRWRRQPDLKTIVAMRELYRRAARRHRRNTHTLAARGRRQIERERFEAALDKADVNSSLAQDFVRIVTERYAKDVVLDIDAGLARIVVSRQRQREGQGQRE